MASKEERIEQAQKHEALVKGAFASNTEESIAAARVYEEGEARIFDLPEAPFESTETIVTTSFLTEALYRFGRGVCALVDPAASIRPGGNYMTGAFGPEQRLCIDSNLYEVLCGIRKDFHDQNRNYRRGMLFTDRAAFLPDIVFLRRGTTKNAHVIAIAEPQQLCALENHRSQRECNNELRRRIDTLLRIAALNGCETLLCNDFACGRMGYEASQVVAEFKAWLDERPGALGRVVFAVRRPQFNAFNEVFGTPKETSRPPRREDEESREDFEDWRFVDLPEGVTLR